MEIVEEDLFADDLDILDIIDNGFPRRRRNGLLSDPDFRYRPRQFGERRGKYIKVEQTPCQEVLDGFSTGSRLVQVRGYDRSCTTGAGEPVEEDRIGWETVTEEFQPKRRGG
ncbi:hypothetical protein GEV33_003980 [Tenebrio molitor]|uniref:Uncharacterized protein n=1 Tax=Tenebrio molitor TaxID=7067 RepID=A0A8J6LN64_TENMO|nr:hypothetical protein GEV33_003980 [Tenebrio molitor]